MESTSTAPKVAVDILRGQLLRRLEAPQGPDGGPEKKSRFPREMGMVGPHLCQLGGRVRVVRIHPVSYRRFVVALGLAF